MTTFFKAFTTRGGEMISATLAVLKRLRIVTLAALGTVALTAGPAFSQNGPGDGNIPAPDLFEDQIKCSENVPDMLPMPSVVDRKTMASALDGLLRTPSRMPQMIIEDADLADLVYIIPPDMANCGRDDDFTFTARDGAPYDVAQGYVEVLTSYTDLVTKEDAVAAAQTSLRTAMRGVTPTKPNTAAITVAQTVLATAQEELLPAQNALNQISMGPIYQAGIAEWRAKGAVVKGIASWNRAVPGLSTANSTLGDATYKGYVALDNDVLVAALTDPTGAFDVTKLDAYLGVGKNFVTPNFDASGNLIVPMMATPAEDDPPTAMQAVRVTNSVTEIKAFAGSANAAVAALEKAAAENQNTLQQPKLDEALRRARLEAAHRNTQLAEALADNTAFDANAENALDSIATRKAAADKAAEGLAVAEVALRTAVEVREAATRTVQMQFTSPAAFYEQLLARREALKAQAENVVNRVVANDGTPTRAQTGAVQSASTALTAAEKAQADYQALLADPNDPTVALLATLLEPDGDDGQALVDAISSNYDQISDLTGSDGAVSTNVGNIATNAGNIATNSTNIATNSTNIATNAGNIATNREDIDTNTAHLEDHEERITTNTTEIARVEGRVDTNWDAIGANQMDIATNRSNINGLRKGLDVATAGVAAAMALAALPDVEGARSFGVGLGTFDGKTAVAVGFSYGTERFTFKVGAASSSGETGGSAGIGWSF